MRLVQNFDGVFLACGNVRCTHHLVVLINKRIKANDERSRLNRTPRR
jgi:hypothetical protein